MNFNTYKIKIMFTILVLIVIHHLEVVLLTCYNLIEFYCLCDLYTIYCFAPLVIHVSNMQMKFKLTYLKQYHYIYNRYISTCCNICYMYIVPLT